MITVSGKDDGKQIKARRFSPRGFTKFTKTSTSSDAIGGANLNPKCLVNLKKKDQVDLYVGNKNFLWLRRLDSNSKFTDFSKNVSE